MKAGWPRGTSLRLPREAYLAAILILEAVVSIGFVPGAAAHGDLLSASIQEKPGSKSDYVRAAEAFQKDPAQAAEWTQRWMKWADLLLERFRILELKLRSSQSGMAVVLRLQAYGLYSGPETREELLRQSATADPEQQGIWGELGLTQVKRGMLEEAAATLKTAQERQPQDLQTLQLEAMMAAAQGDWKQAEELLRELRRRSPAMFGDEVRNWPQNLVPQQNVVFGIWGCVRARSAFCVERGTGPVFPYEGWQWLETLPKLPPEQAAVLLQRGVFFVRLEDCPRAIPVLEGGVSQGAGNAAYWLELCYATEAERLMARLGESENQAVFHRVRGDFLVRVKGDMNAATEEYTKAKQLDPRDPVLAERLAQAYENIGDMPRAKTAAHQALALDPRRAVSLRLLASIAMNERDYANALESLNKLLALRPNDAWASVQLGIACAQTGQPQEALANLQPALAAGYPDERGALHAMLASVLRKLGREQEAQSASKESARLSNLFQQHGQGPATQPEERPREPR